MKTCLPAFLVSTLAAVAHPSHDSSMLVTAPSVPSEVSIIVEGAVRVIRANGMPDHPTGAFPVRGNPNRIGPQRYEFRVPARPERAAEATPVNMNFFGVAVNGVIFDAAAAEWWQDDRTSGWQYEALGGGRNLGIDPQHAHVQPTGAYHYHGLPTALLNRLTSGEKKIVLLGWAADGFPIYGPWIPTDRQDMTSALKRAGSSYRLKPGDRPDGPGGSHDGTYVRDWSYVAGAGDLDEFNGREGVTPEFPGGTYYYVVTDEFPFVPRMWRGTPDNSFMRRGPAGGPGRDGGKRKKAPPQKSV
jgi:hypothetical protein